MNAFQQIFNQLRQLQDEVRSLKSRLNSISRGTQLVVTNTSSVAHSALLGLLDDTHTQYLKEKAAGGVAAEVPIHTHAGATEAGQIDADDVTYTPTTLADWDAGADPGDVEQALDQLAERVTDVEGGSSGGASVHHVPIPFGAETEDGGTRMPADDFARFGNVRRIINPANFPDYDRAVLEIQLRQSTVGFRAEARLYNVTLGAAVSGSEVETYSTSAVRLRSDSFALPAGDHEYEVQFGGENGGTVVGYDALVIMGDDQLIGGI